jgi:hypothetical protein
MNWIQYTKSDLRKASTTFIEKFEEAVRRQERARMIEKYNIRHGEDDLTCQPLSYHVREVSQARSDLHTHIEINSHIQ